MCFVLLKLSDEEHENAKVTLKTKESPLICIQTHKRESECNNFYKDNQSKTANKTENTKIASVPF